MGTFICFTCFWATFYSCDKGDYLLAGLEPDPIVSILDTTVVFVSPNDDPLLQESDLDGIVSVSDYASLDYKHQSAAVFGDYAFFVVDGRKNMCLYDMVHKNAVYNLSLKGEKGGAYHCNQSSFGIEKYYSRDYFPLLYVSQRAVSDNRCLTEVFRIIPFFSADSTALVGFNVEMVQRISFPPMTKDNSMGYVNCVIDPDTGWMYTYSRNQNASDSNYHQCKISRFSIPDIHEQEVFLEDTDIESSFMINVVAKNMQGGCIVDGRLYIGQGYPLAKYVYLNVIDLEAKKLIKRYNLLEQGVDWEPEGCFYYDGSLMLSHTDAICRIVEKK